MHLHQQSGRDARHEDDLDDKAGKHGATPGAQTQVERDGLVQPKSEYVLGAAGNSFETEADSAADTVMGGGSVGSISSTAGSVQRASEGGGGEDLSHVQRAVDGGGGHGMSSATQGQMESGFGRSFSGVTLHTDSAAATAASSIGASAFTVGQDVFFGANRYQPESDSGQHLLAHELTHTVQQGSGASVQRKVIQRDSTTDVKSPGDSKPPAGAGTQPGASGQGADAPGAAPTNVKTTWALNFDDAFNGVDKQPTARTSNSSLYVNEFKAQPKPAKEGDAPPAPFKVSGATLNKTGAATIGTYDHPKDAAGMASANVAFGKIPTFNFTITTPALAKDASADDKKTNADAKQAGTNGTASHKAMVAQWTGTLSDFTNEADAKTKLDAIVVAKFPGATTTVSMTEEPKPAINTTDYTYPTITGPKTMNLKVTVPTAKKDVQTTWTKGETNDHAAGGSNKASEQKSVGTQTTLAASFTQSMKSSWSREIKRLTDVISSTATSDSTESIKDASFTVDGSAGGELSTAINGGGEFALSDKIPVVGKYLKDLLPKANLTATIGQKLSGTLGFSHTSKDSDAKKHIEDHKTEFHSALSDAVTTQAESVWTSSISSQVQTNYTATSAKEEEAHHDDKKGDTKGASGSAGGVRVVSDTLKPSLVAE